MYCWDASSLNVVDVTDFASRAVSLYWTWQRSAVRVFSGAMFKECLWATSCCLVVEVAMLLCLDMSCLFKDCI